jgi:hypothetical protein
MTDKTQAMKQALEALEWMVANDDTNEGDEPLDRLGGQSWNEYNAYWLDGLNNARASITALQKALATPQALPDVLTQEYGDSAQYVEGWNECREVMAGMMK